MAARERNTSRAHQTLDASLEGAERACRAQGLRLTEKRRSLLTSLLKTSGPVSAYELANTHRMEHGKEIPVMTVYRMLDVFMDAGIVHKLCSTNRFIPCRHMACEHPHAATQFLICDSCGLVEEADFGEAEIKKLDRKARSSGFHLSREQLELHGLCDRCHSAGRY